MEKTSNLWLGRVLVKTSNLLFVFLHLTDTKVGLSCQGVYGDWQVKKDFEWSELNRWEWILYKTMAN